MVSTRKVRVSAMLDKLPDSISVDISNLMIGKSIYAEDINVEGVQILTPPGKILCTVKMTRAAIGAAAAAAAAAASDKK
jgi:large subunit ribosomal protein L25